MKIVNFVFQILQHIDKYTKLSYNKIVLNELHIFCVRLITFVYKHDRHLARSFFLQFFQIFCIDKMAFSWYNENIYKWKSRHQNVVFAPFFMHFFIFLQFFWKMHIDETGFLWYNKNIYKRWICKRLGFSKPFLFVILPTKMKFSIIYRQSFLL